MAEWPKAIVRKDTLKRRFYKYQDGRATNRYHDFVEVECAQGCGETVNRIVSQLKNENLRKGRVPLCNSNICRYQFMVCIDGFFVECMHAFPRCDTCTCVHTCFASINVILKALVLRYSLPQTIQGFDPKKEKAFRKVEGMLRDAGHVNFAFDRQDLVIGDLSGKVELAYNCVVCGEHTYRNIAPIIQASKGKTSFGGTCGEKCGNIQKVCSSQTLGVCRLNI